MNNNQPPYKNFDPLEALEHIFIEFDDFYFYKRISKNDVLKVVKDYWYLHQTGFKYQDFSDDKKKYDLAAGKKLGFIAYQEAKEKDGTWKGVD